MCRWASDMSGPGPAVFLSERSSCSVHAPRLGDPPLCAVLGSSDVVPCRSAKRAELSKATMPIAAMRVAAVSTRASMTALPQLSGHCLSRPWFNAQAHCRLSNAELPGLAAADAVRAACPRSAGASFGYLGLRGQFAIVHAALPRAAPRVRPSPTLDSGGLAPDDTCPAQM
jgi:hypothetical protein